MLQIQLIYTSEGVYVVRLRLEMGLVRICINVTVGKIQMHCCTTNETVGFCDGSIDLSVTELRIIYSWNNGAGNNEDPN